VAAQDSSSKKKEGAVNMNIKVNVDSPGTYFTCFTSTKSTKTDPGGAACQWGGTGRAGSRAAHSSRCSQDAPSSSLSSGERQRNGRLI
jgi:hypothetical protein